MLKSQIIGIIGYGKVGKVLAKAFIKAGFSIQNIIDRKFPSNANSIQVANSVISISNNIKHLSKNIQFLIICVKDKEINSVLNSLLKHYSLTPDIPVKPPTIQENSFKQHPENQFSAMVVAHTAGSLSSEILKRVREFGALPLAWHPMQTLAGDEEASIFQGVTFGMDGAPIAVRRGESVTRRLGGIPVLIDPKRKLEYHLSSVFASNLITALLSIANEMLIESGMEEPQTYQALEPLMNTTIRNVVRLGLPDAITGPVAREDIETIFRHLDVLKKTPQVLEIYKLLSKILMKKLGKNGLGEIGLD